MSVSLSILRHTGIIGSSHPSVTGHSHGGSPIAGWFFLEKIIENPTTKMDDDWGAISGKLHFSHGPPMMPPDGF